MKAPNLHAQAREIMKTRLVAAQSETSGRDIAFQLLSGLESGLPVVEGDMKLIGVVTQFDLLKALEEGEDLSTIKAGDIMSVPPITVAEEASIREVLSLMRKERIHGVPVVRDGKMVGTIFRRDLLSHLISSDVVCL